MPAAAVAAPGGLRPAVVNVAHQAAVRALQAFEAIEHQVGPPSVLKYAAVSIEGAPPVAFLGDHFGLAATAGEEAGAAGGSIAAGR